VAHNHPSGSLNPSTADLEVTERMQQSAKLLGINLIDHIIVTGDKFATI
jgi:DNA repair protein RadC